jgi:peroxiredoxin
MQYWWLSLAWIICFGNMGFAQQTGTRVYPKNYFRNPLGIPMQLSGNFGELRKDHYHMGLDLRTNRKENLPVYAAAAGYISRIAIQTYGYGRAIYITHPNGYTTVYGHLNQFYDTLQHYLTAKQYEDEQWEQDLQFLPHQFPVTKGQFIAYSGNTGSSQGPHLHFEIRDSETGNNLNPLHFGLPVADSYAPTLFGLYMADGGFSSYRSPYYPIKIKKQKTGYTTVDTVVQVPYRKIRIGINAEDRTNTSSFYFGVYRTELWLDAVLQSGFQFEDFSYANSRYINAGIDYPYKQQNGRYVMHLQQLPGNLLDIFDTEAKNGVLELKDSLPHVVQIVLKDIKGNTTSFSSLIQFNDSAKNYLPAVTDVNAAELLPSKAITIGDSSFQIYFPANTLYDTAQFIATAEAKSEFALSPYYRLTYPFTPLHRKATVKIKPSVTVPDSLKEKVVIRITRNKQFKTQKVSWQGLWAYASFNELGDAELLYDTVGPVITPISFKDSGNITRDKALVLTVADRLNSFVSVRTELDGKWLMFHRKDNVIIYDFDERCPNGTHDLRIVATDECGNISEQMFRITVEDKPKKVIKKSKKKSVKKKTKMTPLTAGTKAPAFTGTNQNGETIKLSDFKGKKLVLYFYPQDDTPTCTVQACNLRDNYALLKKQGFEIIGISPDEVAKHKKFETKHNLPFNIIADPKLAIIEKYGVWGEKQLYGRKYLGLHRTTFVIDEKGIIRKILLKPKSKQHAEEIIAAWEIV